MINNLVIISIVVPCYNEAEVVLSNIDKAIKISSKLPIEFVFINNGSTDNTANIFNSVKQKIPPSIKLLTIKKNKGYGFGVKKGIALSRGEYIGWTHGDGQADIMDIKTVFDIIINNPSAGIIKGKRISRPFRDRLISFGLEIITSIFFLKKLNEINAQPSVYKRSYLFNYQLYSNELFFDIDAYITARLNRAKEKRFDVVFPPRLFGVSSWQRGILSKFKFITLTFNHIIKLRLAMKIFKINT